MSSCVRAALHDPPAPHDEDLVRGKDGRQPVRDRDRRAALHQPLERGLDEPLADRVERRGRLVQDQDARVLSSTRAMATRCFSPPESL